MIRFASAILAVSALAFAGCGNTGTSNTKPNDDTKKTKPADAKELDVTVPKKVTVDAAKTEKFTVKINRDNFKKDVMLSLEGLPEGVKSMPAELKIPVGQDSIEVTLDAKDAKPSPAKTAMVKAKSDGLNAEANFDVEVK